jgi:lysozyme
VTIEDVLIRDEGMKLRVYQDTQGKMTIGVGRNLEDVGISEEEALLMLRNDIAVARRECSKYPWFRGLDEARELVVVSMMFNMGASKFAQFQRFHAAVAKNDFQAAASEMQASHWASQVGKRAVRLAEIMRSGQCSAQ